MSETVADRSTRGMRVVRATRDGRLWAGGNPGLFTGVPGKFRWIAEGPTEVDPQPAQATLERILDLDIAPDGTPFVLTWNGLGKLTGERFQMLAGVPPAPRYPDEARAKWPCTNQSTARLAVDTAGTPWVVAHGTLFRLGAKELEPALTGNLAECLAARPDGSILVVDGGALKAVRAGPSAKLQETRLADVPRDYVWDLVSLGPDRAIVLTVGGAMLVDHGECAYLDSVQMAKAVTSSPAGDVLIALIDGTVKRYSADQVRQAGETIARRLQARSVRASVTAGLPQLRVQLLRLEREMVKKDTLQCSEAMQADLLFLAAQDSEMAEVRFNAISMLGFWPEPRGGRQAVLPLLADRDPDLGLAARGLLRQWGCEPP